MRKSLLLSIILLATLSSFAQGFTNYKAVITDNSGSVLNNQNVAVRFTIFDGDPSSSGVQVFQETHNTTTDDNGIIVLNIGEANFGSWITIDWSEIVFYLQTEYDTGSGFVDMGTQAFRTVPYAQYAHKSQYSIYAQHADEIDFNDITNVPAGLSDGDDDTTYTAGTGISISAGNVITNTGDTDASDDFSGDFNDLTNVPAGLSNGDDDTHLTEAEVDTYVSNNGYLTSEVDGSTTNELQTINKIGSTVTLSNGGGSFTDDDTQLTEAEVDTYVSNNGYATELNELSDAKTGGNSVFIGAAAGFQDDESDNNNVGIGYYSLPSNTNGHDNIAIGLYSLQNNQTGNYNIALGVLAGNSNNAGSGNIFLGHQAGYLETGSNKLYIENSTSSTPLIGGDFSTDEVTINGTLQVTGGIPGDGKVFTSDANGKGSWETPVVGATELNDLNDAITGGNSVFIGTSTGINDDGTNNNVGIGKSALTYNTTGNANIAIGEHSLFHNHAGNKNIAIGDRAMIFANNSDTSFDGNNIAIGYNALAGPYDNQANNTGQYNTSIGSYTLLSNTSGDDNIAMGYNALNSNSTGSKNVALGNQAGKSNTAGNANIFLGYRAGYYETGSDKLYIDNTDTATPLIGGNFITDEVTINGTLQVRKSGGNISIIESTTADADLHIKSTGSNNPGVHLYNDGTFKASLGYNVANDAFFIYQDGNTYFKDGNILPDGHISRDLGANGTAWNNVYAHNYITQGSAAFTDRSVTQEILQHKPVAKKDGDFDAQSEGLYELNPNSLPTALHTENGLKIDEIATYNYKANYEQQVIINKQQNEIEALKTLINKQQELIERLAKEIQNIKQE